MFKKINWKRVVVTAVGVFGLAFIGKASGIAGAVGAGDFSTGASLAWSGVLAGLAGLVEAGFHAFSKGFGDPTTPK